MDTRAEIHRQTRGWALAKPKADPVEEAYLKAKRQAGAKQAKAIGEARRVFKIATDAANDAFDAEVLEARKERQEAHNE